MKRAALALVLAIAVFAGPAAAAVSSSHSPVAQPQRKPMSDIEKLIQMLVEKDSTERLDSAELPLECRGYYVRAKAHRAAAQTRCE